MPELRDGCVRKTHRGEACLRVRPATVGHVRHHVQERRMQGAKSAPGGPSLADDHTRHDVVPVFDPDSDRE